MKPDMENHDRNVPKTREEETLNAFSYPKMFHPYLLPEVARYERNILEMVQQTQ